MAKIQEVNYPFGEVATDLIVYVQGFNSNANTCTINYILTTEIGKQLLSDRYELTEEEFQGWGQDNTYLDQIAADKLGVVIIVE
jgi:hypothetical protein